MRGRAAVFAAFMACGAVGAGIAGGCDRSDPVRLHGQVRVTLLHTSDIHSRLFPYNLLLGQVDANLGLGDVGNIANVGGAARMSHIIGRERARSERVLHLDGGDCFQGAPVFNFYLGEAEIKALSAMGADAMIIANHEFDQGALNLGIQLQNWANFPALVANYKLEDPEQPGASPLGTVIDPFTVFNLDGLRVAVIGMGNLSSLTSIYDQPNRLGVLPLKTSEVAQFYIDLLRPIVDLVVVVTHLGLEVDQAMIEDTEGIDVVLGGHNHIVLQPPKQVRDCANVDRECATQCAVDNPMDDVARTACERNNCHFIVMASPEDASGVDLAKVRRYCKPRDVVLAHSGAFAKYVGRLDFVASDNPGDFGAEYPYSPHNGFEVLSYTYRLFPVNDQVPEDPIVRRALEPYEQGLDLLENLDLLVGYAPDGSARFSSSGGDSPLGNLIATAMWLRLGVQTDFSLTNTTGIRADVVPGPVDVEQMYNIFPFDNSITKMQLSGKEVKELFDFVARRSSGRACTSQAQIAGARVVLACDELGENQTTPGVASAIYIGLQLDPDGNTISCIDDAPCGGQIGSCDISIGRCWRPIELTASYELATSNYLAGGGSGFRVLQRNTTQNDTKIQQRDALIDYLRGGRPCGANPVTGAAFGCSTDADCQGLVGPGFVCACAETTIEGPMCTSDPAVGCQAPPPDEAPGPGQGGCVLARCRDEVAAYQRQVCERAPSQDARNDCLASILPCANGGEQCKFLACIDQSLGNLSDGRLRMEGK
jgi:5'-nucleotidase